MLFPTETVEVLAGIWAVWTSRIEHMWQIVGRHSAMKSTNLLLDHVCYKMDLVIPLLSLGRLSANLGAMISS
jgi:hypothetical protein